MTIQFWYVLAYDYMLKLVVDFDGEICGQFPLLLSNFYSLCMNNNSWYIWWLNWWSKYKISSHLYKKQDLIPKCLDSQLIVVTVNIVLFAHKSPVFFFVQIIARKRNVIAICFKQDCIAETFICVQYHPKLCQFQIGTSYSSSKG